MTWLSLLILVHILSAIIGVGPTFFSHYLLREKQNMNQLRASLTVAKALDFFPKIGGTIALLSGIALILSADYGNFMVLWQFGSLVIYFIIQIIAIGFLAPANKKLAQVVFDPASDAAVELNDEQKAALKKSSNIAYLATFFGITLFVFMILKPVVF